MYLTIELLKFLPERRIWPISAGSSFSEILVLSLIVHTPPFAFVTFRSHPEDHPECRFYPLKPGCNWSPISDSLPALQQILHPNHRYKQIVILLHVNVDINVIVAMGLNIGVYLNVKAWVETNI